METGVLVAIIVALSTLLNPLLTSWLTNRNLRAVKQDDYRRQDEVAKMVREATEAAAAAAEKADHKQDAIHALVNSSMTAALQSELGATIREVAMMREVMGLNEAAGREPSREALDAIAATQLRVEELNQAMADRLSQTRVAEAAISKDVHH